MPPEVLTPARRIVATEAGSLNVLSDPGIGYADGGEINVLSILTEASDLASASDELAAAATDWATEYATSRSRANFLRALELPADAVVLEVGGGNGAISRYLGETCAVVDMVEPVQSRAQAAVARTRDLPNVRVFQGVLNDIPQEPTYDIVVVCGVLEYIGAGSKSTVPYTDFLEACTARLKPHGTLVLAIENAIGVKYLAGASEDHTGRPFDGLEGYLLPSGARTFTRTGLEALINASGLQPTTYGAFPDYKLTRALLSDSLIAIAPDAMVDIPSFPSRDYSMLGIHGADEKALWRQLVEAGTAFEHCNSWVVVATKGEPQPLWPQERIATLVLAERGASHLARTDFVHTEVGVTVRRHSIATAAPAKGEFVWSGGEEPLVPGPLLSALLAEDATRADALRAWKQLVLDTPGDPVDLVPWNVVVTDNGLIPIDQEWHATDYPAGARLARGVVLSVARWAREQRWLPGDGTASVLDVAKDWASEGGIMLSEPDLETFVDREAAFQEFLAGPPRAEGRARLESLFTMSLCDVRGTARVDQGGSESVTGAAQVAALWRIAALETELRLHQEHKATVEVAYLALEGEVSRLENVHRDQETAYRDLDSAYRDLEASYRGLEASYRGLEASYIGLEDSHRDLQAKYGAVEAQVAQFHEKPLRSALASGRQRVMRKQGQADPPGPAAS
jgi:precorrin-6B methylase 2